MTLSREREANGGKNLWPKIRIKCAMCLHIFCDTSIYSHTHAHVLPHTHTCKSNTRTHSCSLNFFFQVCISILHPHGRDVWGYEKPEERWMAVQSVEKILVSVMSMLAEPNDQSPANIDAAVSACACARARLC